MEDSSEKNVKGAPLIPKPPKWENPFNLTEDKASSIKEILQESSTTEYPERGEVSFQDQGITIDFTYEPYHSSLNFNPRTLLERYALKRNVGDARILTSFNLQDVDKTEEISLYQIIPDQWKVIFFPDNAERNGSANNITKTIAFNGAPTSISNILTLLHEAGHAHDFNQKRIRTHNLAVSKLKSLIGKPNEGDLNYILTSERNAWSFALNKLRPFISKNLHSDLKRETVYSIIHDIALASYNEEISQFVLPKEEYIEGTTRLSELVSQPIGHPSHH